MRRYSERLRPLSEASFFFSLSSSAEVTRTGGLRALGLLQHDVVVRHVHYPGAAQRPQDLAHHVPSQLAPQRLYHRPLLRYRLGHSRRVVLEAEAQLPANSNHIGEHSPCERL